MGWNDLKRIINERRPRVEQQPRTQEQLEIEESRALLQQLHENYIRAYKNRKEKWFKEHPDQKYFSPTLEEHRRDCEVSEWFYFFIQRIISRNPEQTYQDEKRPDYGWNHLSKVHTIDEPCKEGCRFWPETGKIEDVEGMHEYKGYQDYNKVRSIWEEATAPTLRIRTHNDITVNGVHKDSQYELGLATEGN